MNFNAYPVPTTRHPLRNGAIGAVVLVGGLYVAAKHFGPGDCAASVFSGDIGKMATQCFGAGFEGGGDATVQGDGPKTLAVEMVNNNLTMTFGEVEVTMKYPRGANGDLTKVDW